MGQKGLVGGGGGAVIVWTVHSAKYACCRYHSLTNSLREESDNITHKLLPITATSKELNIIRVAITEIKPFILVRFFFTSRISCNIKRIHYKHLLIALQME